MVHLCARMHAVAMSVKCNPAGCMCELCVVGDVQLLHGHQQLYSPTNAECSCWPRHATLHRTICPSEPTLAMQMTSNRMSAVIVVSARSATGWLGVVT